MGDLLITYYSAGIVTIWSKGLRGKFPLTNDLEHSVGVVQVTPTLMWNTIEILKYLKHFKKFNF